VSLATVWTQSLRALHARGDIAGAGVDLLARYGEPHRHYHTTSHLRDVLAGVGELADVATDAAVVQVAAFYHDAVYDPLRVDNEERSADLAQTVLGGLGVDAAVVSDIARLVLVTETHETEPDDRDGAVLCDADLAVLGRDPADYADYVASVRAEFVALDDGTWSRGRRRVLRRLLARPTLFGSALFRQRYEAQARANVMGELATLGQDRPGGRRGDADPPPSDG